jgi:hypothetical protein
MLLRTTVRDCLYLNWALPAEAVPAPPAPLRYQYHAWQGQDYVFASALLFYQDALHLPALSFLKVCYPQVNLRLYVLDEEGMPSILVRRMLTPAWVAPGMRLVTHHPVARARLDLPRPSRNVHGGPWRWRVERGGRFEVQAWPDSPLVGEGPRLGSWEQTVRYFQERPRGYAEDSGVLHRIDARHPASAVWPLRAEVVADALLPHLFHLASGARWPALHSAWLCPEIPFVFDLGIVPKVAAVPAVPQPAAGRVAAVWRQGEALRPPAEAA